MTELMYQIDGASHFLRAKILEIDALDSGLYSVVLDRTIFHPQGGGQPSDQGTIASPNAQFDVDTVRYDHSSQKVHHQGRFRNNGCAFRIEEQVDLQIDGEKRRLFTRLHSAGHLVDHGLEMLGFKIAVGKGYHFPDSPHVEYTSIKRAADGSGAVVDKTRLEDKCNHLIGLDVPVAVHMMEHEKVPEDVKAELPASVKSRVRLVEYGGMGMRPCGGTHVSRTGEVGRIFIKRISTKGGNTRISYNIS